MREMAGQEEGLVGKLVGGMIRRSVRQRFHSVHWVPPSFEIPKPCILVANHHGWHDGYLMFHLITRLGVRCVDWIAEFDAFPLFSKIGGMPFPPNDPARRTQTIRRTIRLMKEEQRSLVLFAEGVLHYPPELLPFGKSLEVVAKAVEDCAVLPVAIKYEMAMHERPEAFIMVGQPVERGKDLLVRTRDAVQRQLAEVSFRIRHDRNAFERLAAGTLDVNERWDMRRIKGKR